MRQDEAVLCGRDAPPKFARAGDVQPLRDGRCWDRADNLTEAIAMARNYMGNSAEITMLHQPMIGIADME